MGELGDIFDDFDQYSKDLQQYLNNNVKDNFGWQDIRTPIALQVNSKQLNIPDPLAAGKQVRDDMIINSVSNKFESNPAVNGAGVSNEINRIVTRGAASGVMGERGQLRLKLKLLEVRSSIDEIKTAVQSTESSIPNIIDAACEVVTGISNATQANPAAGVATDTLKNAGLCQANIQLQTLKILAEQSKINAETLGQTMQTNQALQYSNLNLANISQQVEETNRARRVDSSAEAARLLRTTSQIDLFGREP
jgi:hypothetical protein